MNSAKSRVTSFACELSCALLIACASELPRLAEQESLTTIARWADGLETKVILASSEAMHCATSCVAGGSEVS